MDDEFFIIDWDLPKNNPNRFTFYRELTKVKKQLGLHGQMSSMSVLITRDATLAYKVFEIAKNYATRVHLYKGRQVE